MSSLLGGRCLDSGSGSRCVCVYDPVGNAYTTLKKICAILGVLGFGITKPVVGELNIPRRSAPTPTAHTHPHSAQLTSLGSRPARLTSRDRGAIERTGAVPSSLPFCGGESRPREAS